MRAALVLLAAVLGSASPTAAQVPPPPGKMVDVGGYKLHVNCTGAGSPTVILEAGASSFSIDWALVQPSVSRTNRVCSYDRAGYGWSEPGPYDFRGEDAVMSLRAALTTLGEKPPFVLVGQSMGGRFVRLFARRYPAEVVGMVLVDAEHEDGLFMGVGGKPVAISSLSDAEFDAAYQPPSGPPPALPAAALQLQSAHLHLPADLQQTRLLFQRRFFESMAAAKPDAIVATMRSEHTTLLTLHQIDTSEAHPLDTLPLIVLSRGLNTGPRQRASQDDLARLSTNSRHIVVDDSDHEIHLFRPDIVIQAIADVQKGK